VGIDRGSLLPFIGAGVEESGKGRRSPCGGSFMASVLEWEVNGGRVGDGVEVLFQKRRGGGAGEAG
jgi:hypothetical protein